ncbi:hypothetical protein L596_019675 [Steinernema carpocapsae]|nr:hypothetical protein L596_019675 [Steinernema carpocapsae]
MQVMKSRFPDVVEKAVFAAWSQLRVDHFENRLAARNLKGKLDFLNSTFTVRRSRIPSPSSEEEESKGTSVTSASTTRPGVKPTFTVRRSRIPSEESMSEENDESDHGSTFTAQGYPGKKNGEEYIDALIDEMKKHPQLCSVNLSGNTPLKKLKIASPEAWESVMQALKNCFFDMTEERVFASWRMLRVQHFKNRLATKNLGKLDFLNDVVMAVEGSNEKDSNQGEESDDLNVISTPTTRPGRNPEFMGALIDEMKKYPDLYCVRLGLNTSVDAFYKAASDDWKNLMQAIRNHFPEVFEERVFACWRLLRVKHFGNRLAARNRGKLDFLNGIVQTRAAVESDDSSEDSDAEESLSPTKKRESLFRTYGDEAVNLLLAEVAKYPDVYTIIVSTGTKFRRFREAVPSSWTEIMQAMECEYPGIREKTVFSAWKYLRYRWSMGVLPRKHSEKLFFLDPLEEAPLRSRERSSDDSDESDRSTYVSNTFSSRSNIF